MKDNPSFEEEIVLAKHGFKSLNARNSGAAYKFSRMHTHCNLKLPSL